MILTVMMKHPVYLHAATVPTAARRAAATVPTVAIAATATTTVLAAATVPTVATATATAVATATGAMVMVESAVVTLLINRMIPPVAVKDTEADRRRNHLTNCVISYTT